MEDNRGENQRDFPDLELFDPLLDFDGDDEAVVEFNDDLNEIADEDSDFASPADSAENSDDENVMGARAAHHAHGNAQEGEPSNAPSEVRKNNDEKKSGHERKISYNRSLPATHAYLGSNLEDVGVGERCTFMPEEIINGVPLFPVPNLILMPGQTLPLQSLHPRSISMFRMIISQSKVFGVVNVDESLAKLGTLAQVLAFTEDTDHEITTLKLRAVGRDRFEILETQRQIDGALLAKIKILPEIEVGDILSAVELPSTSKFKVQPLHSNHRTTCFMKQARCKRGDKYFASAFTPLPWFVYKQYDIEFVTEQIKKELVEWYDAPRIEQLAATPVEFSYWVAATLPLGNNEKMRLLGINSSVQRLRAELSLIKQFTALVCRECGFKIGDKANVFSMSLEGPMGAFVNEHGYVHETLTLTDVTTVQKIGTPTTLNSWFPGYAWTIIQCSSCSRHLGWKFTAARKCLKPQIFYGITRAAVLPSREISADAAAAETSKEESFDDVGPVI